MNVKAYILTVEERLFLAFCHLEKIAKKSLLDKFYDFYDENNIYIMFNEIEMIEKLTYNNKAKKLFKHIKTTLKKASFFLFIVVTELL